jgi:hypothetical protein
LQAKLDASSSTAAGAAAVQLLLAGKIDDAINFYDIESAKLDGAGIRATEAIAKEILTWRAANYFPLESQVNNFILWSGDQTLFQTAETRFTKTQQIVNFIEAAAPNTDFQTKWIAIRSSFADAESENAAAENAISQLLPPDQSFALMEQSLQSLADTYQKFSDLNGLIQKLLPTK